jgi:probable addiction module antidote protein
MFTLRQTEELRDWLDGLKDRRARIRIVARLRQAEAGNLGDWKPVGGEVSEIGFATMSRTKAKPKLLPFDAARYLTDDAAVAEYVTAMLETGDSDLLLLALGDIARARGMAQVAKDAGLGRESLYKALAPGAKPRFDTVMKVAHALGVHFTARVQ